MSVLPATVLAARSWTEFTTAVASLPDTTQQGAAFAHVVRHYLLWEPTYRTKLSEVWFDYDVPADLRTRLNLPPRDKGIDLIARTHSGEFWSIQAKYRADTATSLTFGELSTFTSLSFTICREISFALVCTTTSRIPGILQGLANIGDLTAEKWATLPPEFFASFAASSDTATLPTVKPRPPREHQAKAIAAAIAYYAEPGQTRGKLIHPCGSGKSLTAYWIGRELDARRVLIAVPSLALVRQTLETWMTEAVADARAVDWLCVCSDDEVADVDNEALVAHVHELGIPCDTDPAKLAGHLRTAQARPGLLVVLTTYQSSPVLAAAARDAGTAFDFAVLDEAHKTTGKTSSYYAHLLHDENLPLPRRLFMTATERRFASNRSDDIVSMDDPALYGETIDLLTFKAAIAAAEPILCDYRLLTIGVRESEIKTLVADNRWLDLGPDGLDEVTSLALASLIALRRATALHGVRHTVSFHSSILRASRFREFCNKLNDHLTTETPVTAYHVSGKMGSAARQRELDAFLAATPSLVTNARCLTEGVDVPGIDCVFFADPKGSTIDIVQASGRALRLAPGKQLGYILLPLVVPDGATPEDLEETSAFKFVLTVLRSLATQDDRIVEWFRATSEGRTPEVGGLVNFDMREITPSSISAQEFASQIETKCWERVSRLAFKKYEEANQWALSLNLPNRKQWWVTRHAMFATGDWPHDIPANPADYYFGRGWVAWGDFLGTERFYRVYWPLEKAMEWARERKMRTRADWEKADDRPPELPANPEDYYRDSGWKGWGDFLGTGRVANYLREFWPYEKAREWAISLNIRTSLEWYAYRNGKRPELPPRPSGVPYSPDKSYAGEGWIGWDGFLAFRWRPYPEARAFAQSLKFKGQQEWKAYAAGKRPDLPPIPEDIPKAPAAAYVDHGWISWGDWLGNGQIASALRAYLPYAEARAIVHALGFTTRREWNAFADNKTRFPANLPVRPNKTYADSGWVDWSDWLGSPIIEKPRKKRGKSYRDFESARAFVQSLALGGSLNWPRYVRGEFPDKPAKPADIPASPRNVYRSEWQGWGDWLGSGNIAPRERTFRPFEEARAFARTLGLNGSDDWRKWWQAARPTDLPSNPSATYVKEGFVDWADFLKIPSV